jgi:hypothetical protein
MMFSISPWNQGYSIKLSYPGTGVRSEKFFAYNVDELHEAMDHYYMHNNHSHREPVEGCPLCRAVYREED